MGSVGRGGVGQVKALEVRTLWLRQVVKAKTLTLKTLKSHDICAYLGTKTFTAGTLTLLRSMNGLVDKKEMDDGCRAVRATITSTGESRKQRLLSSSVLEQTLDEIVRNGHTTSGG